jgi:hypothetical protein
MLASLHCDWLAKSLKKIRAAKNKMAALKLAVPDS